LGVKEKPLLPSNLNFKLPIGGQICWDFEVLLGGFSLLWIYIYLISAFIKTNFKIIEEAFLA